MCTFFKKGVCSELTLLRPVYESGLMCGSVADSRLQIVEWHWSTSGIILPTQQHVHHARCQEEQPVAQTALQTVPEETLIPSCMALLDGPSTL